ncbi:unnamed protein product, partial [Polarella glacialis]
KVMKAKTKAGRGQKLVPAQKVTFARANPKLPGSEAYKRYQKYMQAKTVAEALTKGATSADLRYDLAAKHAQLLGRAPPQASAASSSKPARGKAVLPDACQLSVRGKTQSVQLTKK